MSLLNKQNCNRNCDRIILLRFDWIRRNISVCSMYSLWWVLDRLAMDGWSAWGEWILKKEEEMEVQEGKGVKGKSERGFDPQFFDAEVVEGPSG